MIGLAACASHSDEPTTTTDEPTASTEQAQGACTILCPVGEELGAGCKCHKVHGTPCGTSTCNKSQTCCSGQPFRTPTCIDGTICPISQRKMKKDISYLSKEDAQRLNDELLGFRLATYRYKTEESGEQPHLGFIIDDVAPSPAVMSSGERVDMYGYSTMTVAAVQVQARELAELRKEVEELRKETAELRAKSKH
jgi:hypothetical protein